MSMTIDQLFTAAQALSIEEQSELVKRIEATIHSTGKRRHGLREIVEELGLPESARIALADELDYEFDESNPLHPDWKEELERRRKAIEEGTEKMVSHEEVQQMIAEHLAKLKKPK